MLEEGEEELPVPLHVLFAGEDSRVLHHGQEGGLIEILAGREMVRCD